MFEGVRQSRRITTHKIVSSRVGDIYNMVVAQGKATKEHITKVFWQLSKNQVGMVWNPSRKKPSSFFSHVGDHFRVK